jgi:hypothetical protein
MGVTEVTKAIFEMAEERDWDGVQLTTACVQVLGYLLSRCEDTDRVLRGLVGKIEDEKERHCENLPAPRDMH